MASFDIASKTDPQTLDNALNVARKEIVNRFDFRDSKTTIELNKKDLIISILTEDEMRLKSIIDVIRSRMIKQNLDPRCLDEGKQQYASGSMLKKDIKVKQGVDKETVKKILKLIKDSKLKVTAQAMDEIVRVTGKQIDDLQKTMAILRSSDIEIPLQFQNMK